LKKSGPDFFKTFENAKRQTWQILPALQILRSKICKAKNETDDETNRQKRNR